MIHTLTYTDENGKPAPAAYITEGGAYKLSGKREQFCQAVAQGRLPKEAYYEIWGLDANTLSPTQADAHADMLANLRHNTSIVLRIQELQKPILRKLRRTIEYNLQSALDQCATAWDLAHANGDPKTMLKAIGLQAKLSDLLTERIDVTHKNVGLDEETTDMLLAMRDELRVRKSAQKKKLESSVGNIVTVEPTPL